MVITPALITDIRSQFHLKWQGIHGISHWARVYENGLKLADKTHANLTVVRLFSVFHDACRYNDGADPRHGARGAELAVQYRSTHLQAVPDDEFALLYTACRLHTSASTHENITIQTCFDADRLDLGRVGTIPEPQYLCTGAAKSSAMIAWALGNSEAGWVPDNVLGGYAQKN